MAKPNLHKSLWIDFIIAIVQIVIYAFFPTLPVYITILPAFCAIALSLIIYEINMYYYKKIQAVSDKMNNSLEALENENNIMKATISKYEDAFGNVVRDLFYASSAEQSEENKQCLQRIYQHINGVFTRVIMQTNRKKVNIHENSENN